MNYYLVAAYTAIWCVLFVYLFTLSSRQKKLKNEIESLKRQLENP
jgi:CcmD family protein